MRKNKSTLKCLLNKHPSHSGWPYLQPGENFIKIFNMGDRNTVKSERTTWFCYNKMKKFHVSKCVFIKYPPVFSSVSLSDFPLERK